MDNKAREEISGLFLCCVVFFAYLCTVHVDVIETTNYTDNDKTSANSPVSYRPRHADGL